MAEDTLYRFKHKTVRRFATENYEFNNFTIDILGDEAKERFLEVVGRLPDREKVNIVEVNVEAVAEKSLAESAVAAGQGGAVRGAMGADDIKTQKDAGLAAQQNPQGGAIGNGPAAPKPTGFAGLGLNINGK